MKKIRKGTQAGDAAKVTALVTKLNRYRHEYYNLAAPSVADAVYDHLFDELQELEKQTGIILSNSPTQTVGAVPVSSLKKLKHPIPLVGWNVLNDISYAHLGVGFVIDLHFQDSVSCFILGYLMENCPILRQSGKCGLGLGIGQVVIAISVLYCWSCRQHGVEELGSLVMLLAIAVYYLNRYMGEKDIWNNTALHYFILWCGSNVFGIYLTEDYLRNLTAFIWEWSAPHISAVPACCVWLLIVFLLGNVLVSGMRRLPVLKNLL